jgi:putative transposase
MSRQNYYKQRRQREIRAFDDGLVVTLVNRERQQQPRLGTRKLHYMLQHELMDGGVTIGRDRMFRLLRSKGMLVEPMPKAARTTFSQHALPVFHNLTRDVQPTAPNQIWVSDMTYVRTDEDFLYVSLITDRYSRKIVGFCCAPTLDAVWSVRALEVALKDMPVNSHPIHHSDRGCQYCCHEYVHHLKAHGLAISMTEENHCYENAHAERVNGILKQEYGLRATFRTRKQAAEAVSQAIWIYNNRRPHLSLNYRVPAEVHKQAA